MTTWAELLDDYEHLLATVERELASESSASPPGAFEPPELPPDPPTAADRTRLDALAERAEACERRLRAGMAAIGGDLAALQRTRTAGAAYGTATIGAAPVTIRGPDR